MKYQRIGFAKGKQSGFTLIELLMVVVILGILAYVSMSAFSGSPNAANATAIRSGATEVAKGVGYIHANIGNGISTVNNPLLNGSATMLDVLMVGKAAVSAPYKDRFEKLEMRPMESEFRVIGARTNGTTAGTYHLLSYPVTVTDNCNPRKVCVSFDKVPDAVRHEIFTRYGLDTETAYPISSDQPQPVAFTQHDDKTSLIQFALIP